MMLQRILVRLVRAVLVLSLAVAVRADIHNTLSLQSGMRLNLDTGQIVASGGDILWDTTAITPQGSAKAHNIGTNPSLSAGKIYFDAFKTVAKTDPIPASKLVVGDIFVVYTNAGRTAAALVNASTGGTITLEFITFGATPTGPQIDSVLNNSSFIPEGAPNSGIAPSSVFVVLGVNLSDAGAPVLQSSVDPGLPLTLKGASLTVTVNGVTVHPALYYASPAQLAGVLPANTPLGTGTLTVTYNGSTSPPAAINVVAHAPGINTYGTNSSVATDAFSGALFTFTNSAAPGQIITLWTTGLGADPADSDTVFTSTPHEIDTPVQVYIGGIAAHILYRGSAGYPGVNQINLTIPDSVPTGCWVAIAAVAGGVISNVATLPINTGGGPCIDQLSGLTGNQIAPAGGATIRGGLVALIKNNSPASNGGRSIASTADAAFEKYTGIYQPAYSLSPGGCLLVYYDSVPPIPGITGLDAGSISLTGPGGLSVKLASQPVKGAFYALLDTNAIPDSGGTFTFTGTGGADVGPFTSTLSLNPLLVWTNPDVVNNVDRSQGVTVKWTGGNPGSYVYILGTSGAGARRITVSFECLAHADDGQFTVPAYILSALPPGSGSIGLENQISAPLPASGLDAATASATISRFETGTFK